MLNSKYVTLDKSLTSSIDWEENKLFLVSTKITIAFRDLCEDMIFFALYDLIQELSFDSDFYFKLKLKKKDIDWSQKYSKFGVVDGITVFYLPITKSLLFESGDKSIMHFEDLSIYEKLNDSIN